MKVKLMRRKLQGLSLHEFLNSLFLILFFLKKSPRLYIFTKPGSAHSLLANPSPCQAMQESGYEQQSPF